MSARTGKQRQREASGGAGTGEPPPAATRPEQRPWDLHALLAEFRDDAGDLLVHLWTHRRLILGIAAAALLGAMVFAWSGVYSVAATTRHYPFFRTFLAFALRQSVETHAAGITVPPLLDDPAMIRRGAGHYQGGCAPCHGAPGRARNPITRRMLPEPPYLADRIAAWSPAELFWIVKHGIKYAGMPAWVAPEREDEVWSVVAFLQRLPALTPAAYRRLALGEAAAAAATAGAAEGLRLLLLDGPAGTGIAACIRCHGADGMGGGGSSGAATDAAAAFPRLPGQTADYLYEALRAYALGTRPSGIMQPVAAALDDAEMRLLATHYAGQAPAAAPAAPEPADADGGRHLALGRRIALEGLPERGVGACAACHGPKPGPMHPLYPRLAGQHAAFIATQLELWMSGVRGGEREGPLAQAMARAVGMPPRPPPPPSREALWPMRREEIRAVAAWYAAQPAGGDGGASAAGLPARPPARPPERREDQAR